MHRNHDTYAYPATLETDEDDRTIVTFRDLPGAVTDGADRAEALENAGDCLEEAIAAAIAADEDVPSPSKAARGEVVVPVPLRMASKLALHRAMRRNGVGVRELARRLGCDAKEAQRLADPRYMSKIDRLAEAVRAAGGAALELHERELA